MIPQDPDRALLDPQDTEGDGKAKRTPLSGMIRDVAISFLLAALVVFCDFATGVKMNFSLFYVAPVAFLAWRRGLLPGLALALACVLARHFTDLIGGRHYDSAFIFVWNNAARIGILVLAAAAMSRIRREVFIARAAREEALAASAAKSDFLRNMSHEIRTPLNALLAMSELLAESKLDTEQAGYVKVFQAEGRNLLRLLNDLLDDAKIEAGHLAPERIPYSLIEIVEEVASEAGSQARRKGLEFSVDISPDLPPRIMGDPWLLKRTLMNLAGNALKFTEMGEIRLKAGRDPRDGGFLLLSIRDSGIGIPADRLENLFAPFSQADSSIRRRFGGTGLGLSLCKRFVELMGGTIAVESRPGEGSVFSFSIPLELPPEAPSAEGRQQAEAAETFRLPTLRLLVVDDYDVNRQIVRAYLKDSPCRIEEAKDGLAAIEAAKEGNYDLILMDIQMPGLDGIEAAREIRKAELSSGSRKRPMIALTAHAGDADRDATRIAGFDAHLSKPFSKRQLLEALSSFAPEASRTGTAAQEPGSDLAPNPDLDPEVALLIPRYLADMRRLCAEARTADGGVDLAAFSSVGHKLRGSGGVFGFDRLSELGAELEEAARAGDTPTAELTLAQIETILRKA